MRFDNWDILLMPRGSEVPISEFKIEAYSADDVEAAPINGIFKLANQNIPAPAAPSTPPGSSGAPNLEAQQAMQVPQVSRAPLMHSQMPLLSCFVPSQPVGMAFKVSVHSWEEVPFALGHVGMAGGIPCCEVRVFVDGNLVSDGAIKPDTTWPLQIDTGYSANPKLCRGYLRWPKFHEDQLSQNFWSPGEDRGRIKVIISEGIMNQATNRITRTKNIVSFAFHHAPIEILRGANIAWPNERLWLKPDFLVRNNIEENGNQVANTLEEDTIREAARGHSQHPGYPWTSRTIAEDTDAHTYRLMGAVQPLFTPQVNEMPIQQSFATTGSTQPRPAEVANKAPVFLNTSVAGNNTRDDLFQPPDSFTTPFNTGVSLHTPTPPKPRARSSPARKKQATEDKLKSSKPTEQALPKTKPSTRAEAEKPPAKRPRTVKNTKLAGEHTASPTKPPAKAPARARKAPIKKTVSIPPAPITPGRESEDEESTGSTGSENTDGVTTATQDEEE